MRTKHLSQLLKETTNSSQFHTQTKLNQIYRNVESTSSNWSYLIKDHISHGSPEKALLVYSQLRREGTSKLGVTPLILKVCASLSFTNYGKSLHAESIKCGMEFDVIVGTSLVDMYAKCAEIFYSRKVFDIMTERNVITWNAMINGYLRNGNTKSATDLFDRMSIRTSVTWIEMIDGFSRSGDTITARQLFDRVPFAMKNVITWTVMVDGYCSNGEMKAAREVFELMPQRNFYVWSSMISGYCKKGDVMEAKSIFDRIPIKNLVNWNAMISGYAQNGFCEAAIEAFDEMQAEGYEPDVYTFVSVLSICAQSGLLEAGRKIHERINCKGIKCSQIVLNAIVDMYAKCGDLANARLIFEKMTEKNTACWNAMISGLAIHGQCKEALKLFDRMEILNERPDDITFLSVLSACAHGGFVDTGVKIFSKMDKFGLPPRIKHYGCLVDTLGRAGRLREAYNLIKQMPMEPNEMVLGAMLGACRIHDDRVMTERVVKEFGILNSTLGSENDPHYVLLSNIYAASDKWEKAERMRLAMLSEGFRKIPGYSAFMTNT